MAVLDEDGELRIRRGLGRLRWRDGRMRTHLYQTKETGRASSSRPPLQALASSPRRGTTPASSATWKTRSADTGELVYHGDYLQIFPNRATSTPCAPSSSRAPATCWWRPIWWCRSTGDNRLGLRRPRTSLSTWRPTAPEAHPEPLRHPSAASRNRTLPPPTTRILLVIPV